MAVPNSPSNKVADDISGWFGTLSMLIAFVFSLISQIPESKAKQRIDQQQRNNAEGLLAAITGFSYSDKYIAKDYECLIAVDEESNKFCVIDSEVRVVPFEDVLEVELVEDGVQVSKTSRGSQIGGAIVGGVLAGGVGAIIGGLSGNTTTSNLKIKRLYLKIIMNDTKSPYLTVDFLNEKVEISRKDTRAVQAFNSANHWYSLISVLIKRADDLEKQESLQINHIDTSKIADELLKLSELMKQGVLTKEEFEKQKAKLIGN